MAEVIGIDHIYLAVSDLARAEHFYDKARMAVLDFRKNSFTLGGDPHIQYFNRHFGFVLRAAGIEASEARVYPQYALVVRRTPIFGSHRVDRRRKRKVECDGSLRYVATFFNDPGGIRLEVTNYRQKRRERHGCWHAQEEK